MDDQRDFPGEPDNRWYSGERGYPEPDWRHPDTERHVAGGPGSGDSLGPGGTGRYGDPGDDRFTGDDRYGSRSRYPDPGRGPGVGPVPADPLVGGPGVAGDDRRMQAEAGGRRRAAETTGQWSGQDSGVLTPRGGSDPLPADPGHSPLGGYPVVEPGARSAERAQPLDTPTGQMPAIDPAGPVGAGPVGHPVGPVGAGPVGEPMGAGLGEFPPGAGPMRPGGEPFGDPARRPDGALGDGVYRTRRPAVAVVLAVLTLIFELPALRVLLSGATGSPVSAPRVVAGTLLVFGLPLFAIGLHGVASGGAAIGEQARAWLRPPAGYLVAGLALLVAAAIAAG